MGNKRFTDLPAATGVADADVFAVTDVSDLSGSDVGTSKKVTASALDAALRSKVGWLPIDISTAESDWTAYTPGGTPVFADGTVTFSDNENHYSTTIYASTSGAGFSTLLQDSFAYKLSLRVKAVGELPSQTYVAFYIENINNPSLTPFYSYVYLTDDQYSFDVERYNNDSWEYLALTPKFPDTDWSDFHTVTIQGAVDGYEQWRFRGDLGYGTIATLDGASVSRWAGSTNPADYQTRIYVPGNLPDITVDLTQSSLEVKPLW